MRDDSCPKVTSKQQISLGWLKGWYQLEPKRAHLGTCKPPKPSSKLALTPGLSASEFLADNVEIAMSDVTRSNGGAEWQLTTSHP